MGAAITELGLFRWVKRDSSRADCSDVYTCVFGLYSEGSGKVCILQNLSARVWGCLGLAEAGAWGAVPPMLCTSATLTIRPWNCMGASGTAHPMGRPEVSLVSPPLL